MKYLVLFSLILAVALSAPCQNTQDDCQLPAPKDLTVQNVYPFIDTQLKTHYWQYLRNANLLYRANVDQTDRFLFLSIYRNILGTFLSITTWVKGETSVRVNTLVKLGDGYQKDSRANYKPLNINPLTLRYRLGEGQFFIDTNEQGEIQVNGQVVGEKTDGSNLTSEEGPTQEELLKGACRHLDKWIRQHNWQFVRGAEVVHQSGRVTNQRFYCVFNYINVVGTFFALGSVDKGTQNPQLSTLVRLGNGYDARNQPLYAPVDFKPVVLDFVWK